MMRFVTGEGEGRGGEGNRSLFTLILVLCSFFDLQAKKSENHGKITDITLSVW